MTIYLIVFFALMLYGGCANHNITKKRKKRYVIIAFGCLSIIAMLRSYNVGTDLQAHYYSTFLKVVNMEWDNLFTLTYENGYLVFYKLISEFTDNGQWMIAIHALFVIGITGWFIYKNSENVVMSTFLFITTNTWFMYMNIMRQAMAVCIVLIALEIWKKKEWKFRRYILYAVVVLLAMQFHTSAFIGFFIPIFDYLPFKRKQIFFSFIAMIASFFLYDQLYNIVSLFQLGKRDYADFYSSSGEAINIINLYFMFIYLMIFLLGVVSLVYYKRKNVVIDNGNPYNITNINGFSDGFLLYMTLALVMCRIIGLKVNIASRMTYYFIPAIFILLPRAINAFRRPSNRKDFKYIIYVLMTIGFILLGYRSAETLYGTVPYSFFWLDK